MIVTSLCSKCNALPCRCIAPAWVYPYMGGMTSQTSFWCSACATYVPSAHICSKALPPKPESFRDLIRELIDEVKGLRSETNHLRQDVKGLRNNVSGMARDVAAIRADQESWPSDDQMPGWVEDIAKAILSDVESH